MYDHTFYKQVQISRSDTRPHTKWAVSLVILHMITSIFLRALCGYIWVNILTLSPRGDISWDEPSCNINMLQWTLRPKTSVKSAMETAYKNRSVSQQEWNTLPRHLYHQLRAMDEIDAADDKSIGDEANHMIWNVMMETFMMYTKNEMTALMSMII